ncbi:MAG TPA: DUF4410 domain-containing protein [Candidatus Binataceae bacterium]|nr:DUF4410 domain-containing protein [Candidatus Binataceae bacterium]
MKSGLFRSAVFLLALTTIGCAAAKASNVSEAAPEVNARPVAVVVYPFAITPDEVTLNQGFFQKAYREASGANQSAQELQIAHQTAQNVCVQVAADLTQKGISAACLDRGTPPTGSNVLVVDGQFSDINEGNRLRRMVIGLGAGQSTLDTVVQGYQLTSNGSQQILDFSTHADSGYMPGVAVTGPAGAAAGGATAAATLGVNVAASGVKNVTSSTGFLAGKTATQITDQISAYYARQGWGGF